MFRSSQALLRVSQFALYMQELSKAGKLKRSKNICALAAKSYRKLSPTEKGALMRRAEAKSFPAQVAYQRFFKREMKQLSGIPLSKRQALIKTKWKAFKREQSSSGPKPVPSAKKKVKAVSKTAKRISKGMRR
ncbi:hypothetical protein GH5_03359 [Leishmania sp. Ghana 2012 LV757]|uniref:hypothetical protein n=1 Tax=Leishmania sp. Ghana 2012 LV757 TaxID=2803181 RepID=UPI001B4B9BC8|nr:hypothetical protein GH5_03359 [Leishmania sp. Ghana 2012 LV757]